MARWVYACAAISTAAFLTLLPLCRFFSANWLHSAAITSGTTAYHFLMRLLVGTIIGAIPNRCFAYHSRWFRPHPAERTLFRLLRFRCWKNRLPTFAPDLFSRETHTWDEIARAMRQAELVHTVIAVLSFLPLLLSLYFDAFAVFLITSVLAACYDLQFVLLQRYHRPHILRVAMHQRQSHEEES